MVPSYYIRSLIVTAILLAFSLQASAQLVINELSNGPSGSKEYVELVVVGTPGCNNPCIDLRGWILDDNNGYFASGAGTGIAGGHMRFDSVPQWECVGLGAIILVYNNNDRNAAIPPDDPTDANGDCIYIIPASSTLFQHTNTNPVVNGSQGYSGPYTNGGDWQTQGLSNSDDTYQVRDPNNISVPYHAVGYGPSNNNNTIIYFSGTGGGRVYYNENSFNQDPFEQLNWTPGTPGVDETPGAANGPDNAAWISFLNNNCTPYELNVTAAPDTTICAGNAVTLTATSDSTGTFTWSTGPTGSSITVTPLVTTVYYVTLDNGTCIGVDSVTVTVNTLPTAVISGNNTVCQGQTTVLTANPAGMVYLWSTGETSQTITVPNPPGQTQYWVDVTTGPGCTDRDTFNLTIQPAPTPVITGNLSICTGQSTTLDAGPASSYIWSTGATTQTITLSPTADTTVSVTVTNAAGCTGADTVTVLVGASLTPDITGDTAICPGESTTLTVNAGTSWNWSTTDQTQSITVSPTVNTTYSVTVQDGAGCTGVASQLVTVGTAPVVSITGDTSVCQGEDLTLTALPAGATLYAWSTTANTQTVTFTPTGPTVSVTVTNTAGCSAADTVGIVVNTPPTAVITGNNTVCPGETTVLTVNPNQSPQWSTGDVTQSITVPASPGVTLYWAEITDANGCTDRDTFNITILPAPTPVITGNNTICAGDTTTLTVTGGTSWEWSTTGQTQSIDVSPVTNTTYTVTATDANGCTAGSAAYPVTVNLLPLGMVNNDTTICEGSTVHLYAVATPGNTYQWSTTETTTDIDVTPTTGTNTYSLTVTNSHGCVNISDVVITVTPNNVTVAIDSVTDASCAGNDGAIALSGIVQGITYYLEQNGTRLDSNTTGVFNGLAPGSYDVVAENTGGCAAALTGVAVGGGSTLSAAAGSSHPTCFGLANGSIDIAANGAGPFQYSFNGGVFGSVDSFPGLAAGTYTIVVMDTAGCTDTVTTTLTEPTALSASISPDSTGILEGATTSLTAVVSGGISPYSYSWTPAQYLDCATCENVVASPDTTTGFAVFVTDANGCADTAYTIVTVIPDFIIDAPSGFTPNSDGNNDIFRPLASEPITFELKVWNRWGQLIYEGNKGWDGRYKGEDQPLEAYVYLIQYIRLATGEKGTLQGGVTLIR